MWVAGDHKSGFTFAGLKRFKGRSSGEETVNGRASSVSRMPALPSQGCQAVLARRLGP